MIGRDRMAVAERAFSNETVRLHTMHTHTDVIEGWDLKAGFHWLHGEAFDFH